MTYDASCEPLVARYLATSLFSYVVSGFSRTVTVRLKADTTYVYEMASRCALLAPSNQQPRDHQSNFAPNRASRGETIVTGSRNVDPEVHVMFDAGFEFVRL